MATETDRADALGRSGPPYEGLLRGFMESREVDLDAMSVSFLLFRTDNVTLSAMESAALRPNGLTHAGFVLLMTLWMMGPQQTRRLAWVQRVSKPSIVSAVDTLERAGLVRRSRSEPDKRLVTVELTEDGRRTIERTWDAWHECERKIAGVLSRQEQRSLAGMLRRVDEAACAMGSDGKDSSRR